MTSKYTYSVWKRKTASAQVKLFEWTWKNIVNGKDISEYISRADLFETVYEPLKICKLKDKIYFEVKVAWSWESAQAEAIRHWISTALISYDISFRKILKAAWLLTRDARKVERKKPGRHKARKGMQWSKR